MSITIEAIEASSDEELFKLLGQELQNRISAKRGSHEFVSEIQTLPCGLRAMAATYDLDVSLALDDLGWHFANWHHKGYSEETSRGLRELGAVDVAQIFDAAYRIVLPHWEPIASMLAVDFKVFQEWYSESELEEALRPLNSRLWDICAAAGSHRLVKYWLGYARKYPERVVRERA